MICWYCHWGWAKPVADIYDEAVRRLSAIGSTDSVLHWSSGHVVWEDENWDSAKSCLETFDEYKLDYSDEELAILRWSLEELDKLPIAVRCIEPESYDGENPQLFPPTVEVVKR